MDKKSIIGILLIFVILVLFSVLNQPSREQIEETKRKRDSIVQVETEKARQLQLTQQESESQQATEILKDSISEEVLFQNKLNEFGAFGKSTIGEEKFYTIENNLVKLTLSNKGGRIYSSELKEYQTHDSLPLILFDGPETLFGLNFFSQNRSIQTNLLYFTPEFSGEKIIVNGPTVKKSDLGDEKANEKNPGESKSISFKVEVEPGKMLEFIYTLNHNSYMIGFDIKMSGLNNIITANQSYLNFVWSYDIPRQEKISKFGEDNYTNIQYKFFDGDIEQLSQSKSDQKDLSTRIKWISFKQLFFKN